MKKLLLTLVLCFSVIGTANASGLIDPSGTAAKFGLFFLLGYGMAQAVEATKDAPYKGCTETVKSKDGNYVYDRTVVCK